MIDATKLAEAFGELADTHEQVKRLDSFLSNEGLAAPVSTGESACDRAITVIGELVRENTRMRMALGELVVGGDQAQSMPPR